MAGTLARSLAAVTRIGQTNKSAKTSVMPIGSTAKASFSPFNIAIQDFM